jgi:hypothetical protein
VIPLFGMSINSSRPRFASSERVNNEYRKQLLSSPIFAALNGTTNN